MKATFFAVPSMCLSRLVANKCSSCLAQCSTWRPASFALGSYGWTVTNLELAGKWEISALPSICLDRRPTSRRFPWCLLVCALLGCTGYMYSLGTEKLPSRALSVFIKHHIHMIDGGIGLKTSLCSSIHTVSVNYTPTRSSPCPWFQPVRTTGFSSSLFWIQGSSWHCKVPFYKACLSG